MSIDIQKEKVRLSEITHAVRASQAVVQYGVGAMVDFIDQTLMTAAPEYWHDQIEKIHDERLEKVLHVEYFGMPGNKSEHEFGVSYVRFPQWYFCPRCRKFQPIDKWVEEYKTATSMKWAVEKDPHMVKHMMCPKCRQELVVTRIITACEKKGHIDDFPWVKWVHCRNYGGAKEICSADPVLEFKTSKSASEGLDAIEIVCKTCGARASLQGAFEKGILKKLDEKYGNKYDFTCTGNHPWKHSNEICGEYPEVLQRGGSSVYFPHVESSLVIPPYSNLLTIKIENSVGFHRCKDTITDIIRMPNIPAKTISQLKQAAIQNAAKDIALEISVAEGSVLEVLERKWISEGEQISSTNSVKYRAEEYAALSGEIVVPSEEYGDFVRESTNIDDYGIPFIKNVSLIHKIREVQALTGFSRIRPTENGIDESTNNLVSVKEKDTKWYPAYQVRGEGIFIEFDSETINSWLMGNDAVKRRIELLNDNYAKSYLGRNNPRTFSAKFLLLHTISHLLIKQLSFECGYGIASLKERIYCSEESDGKEMAGILIYTASGDSEGTLGGLVRQGRSDTLPYVFRKAIETAIACSNDPVCSLSQGQGRDSLNLGACHSCVLIPETSCEEFNIILDRGIVVGTLENRSFGLYSGCVYNKDGWNSTPSFKNESRTESTNNHSKPIIIGDGVNSEDMAYSQIWEEAINWISDETDKVKLKEMFIDGTVSFEGKEKPLIDCSFSVGFGGEETYSCDLIWTESKVMLFTSENEDGYAKAVESDWKCFLSTREDMDANELRNAVKEK